MLESLTLGALVMGLTLAALVGGAGALLDALGFSLLLSRGQRMGGMLRSLAVVYAASDACARALPAGVVASDAARATLLQRFFDLPIHQGLGSAVARRWYSGVAQGLFLSFAGLIGLSPFLGYRIPQALAIGASSAGAIMLLVLGGLAIASRLRGERDRLPAWMRKAVSTWDATAQSVWKDPRSFLKTLVVFFGIWMLEAGETYLLLKFLSMPIDFGTAFLMEAVVSSGRLLAFFLPAGLGAQEAGYAGFLLSTGVIHQTGGAAAFLVCKRFRDGMLITLGFALLGILGVKAGWRAQTRP